MGVFLSFSLQRALTFFSFPFLSFLLLLLLLLMMMMIVEVCTNMGGVQAARRGIPLLKKAHIMSMKTLFPIFLSIYKATTHKSPFLDKSVGPHAFMFLLLFGFFKRHSCTVLSIKVLTLLHCIEHPSPYTMAPQDPDKIAFQVGAALWLGRCNWKLISVIGHRARGEATGRVSRYQLQSASTTFIIVTVILP
jgi:hypothetical protein